MTLGAVRDDQLLVHQTLSAITLGGFVLMALGWQLYLLSFRYGMQGEGVLAMFQVDRQKARRSFYVSSLVFMGLGVGVLGVGLTLYRNERYEKGQSIPVILQQIKNEEDHGGRWDFMIVTVVFGAMLLMSWMFMMSLYWREHRYIVWWFLPLVVGWLGLALIASTNDRRIDSLEGFRLYYTIPGCLFLSWATYLQMRELRSQMSIGFSWSVYWVGALAFTIGNSTIHKVE